MRVGEIRCGCGLVKTLVKAIKVPPVIIVRVLVRVQAYEV